jgi:hypothetical protein
MSIASIIGMIVLVGIGVFLLTIGAMDNRSPDWTNLVLAAACFLGAVLLRPRKGRKTNTPTS